MRMHFQEEQFGGNFAKKFPPSPLQEIPLLSGLPFSSPRKTASQSIIEVFGEGSGEKPFFKKGLSRFLFWKAHWHYVRSLP